MNAKYSLTLLTTVCFSFGISMTTAHAQQGRLVINPSPLESGNVQAPFESTDVQEPSQSTLMEPIDIEDQKVRAERDLLNSIVVPEPGSSYFDDETSAPTPTPVPMPEQAEEPATMPVNETLTPPSDDVDEYERWAAEQKNKYTKTRKTDPMVPMVVDEEPPPMPVGAADVPVPEKPTGYHSQARISTSPGMTKQVEELGVDNPTTQPVVMQINWNALEGSSVREVLEGWSSHANVELIWMGQSDFEVVNPFVMRSTFERAVQKLLDQYQDSHVRPVATLYVDPDTNKKTLVVRVAEGQ